MTRTRENVRPKRYKKGRSSELIHLRDIALIKRYYYWSEIKRIRTDDVLDKLSTKEFFISEPTIWRIIKRNSDLIGQLRRGESIDIDPVLNKNQLELFR